MIASTMPCGRVSFGTLECELLSRAGFKTQVEARHGGIRFGDYPILDTTGMKAGYITDVTGF